MMRREGSVFLPPNNEFWSLGQPFPSLSGEREVFWSVINLVNLVREREVFFWIYSGLLILCSPRNWWNQFCSSSYLYFFTLLCERVMFRSVLWWEGNVSNHDSLLENDRNFMKMAMEEHNKLNDENLHWHLMNIIKTLHCNKIMCEHQRWRL